MAYLVILNNEADAGEKVLAVAPFLDVEQAKNILTDWCEMAFEDMADFPDFYTADFKVMKEILAEFYNVSVEVVEGL